MYNIYENEIMKNEIKQKELNVRFWELKIDLSKIESESKDKIKKIKKEVNDLNLKKKYRETYAELWTDISNLYMWNPNYCVTYPPGGLIRKKFNFKDEEALKQKLKESVKIIIDSYDWYDSDVKTINMELYANFYLLQLLWKNIDLEKYKKSKSQLPLFSEDIDASIKEYCCDHNIDLKISGLHLTFCPSMGEAFRNKFILRLNKENSLILQINNFEQYLSKFNSEHMKRLNSFNIAAEFYFLYDWLITKKINIFNLLEFYDLIVNLIEQQEQIKDNDENFKLNIKKYIYILIIYIQLFMNFYIWRMIVHYQKY